MVLDFAIACMFVRVMVSKLRSHKQDFLPKPIRIVSALETEWLKISNDHTIDLLALI